MNITLRNFKSASKTLIATASIGVFALTIAHAAPQKALQTDGIQVSEDITSYIVTLPGAANLSLRMEGNTLRLTTADTATGIQSEQNISLPAADTTQQPKIEQQNGNLVVTVGKATVTPNTSLASPNKSSAPANTAPNTLGSTTTRVPAPSAPPAASMFPSGMDQDLATRVQAMQQRMDQFLSATIGSAFADDPFFNSSAPAATNSNNSNPRAGRLDPFAAFGGLSANSAVSADIQDQGQNYIVKAKVPESAAQNLSVAIDNGTTLRITAKDENNGANSYSASNVTQILSLPGPVHADKMQVDNKDGNLTITIPKA